MIKNFFGRLEPAKRIIRRKSIIPKASGFVKSILTHVRKKM